MRVFVSSLSGDYSREAFVSEMFILFPPYTSGGERYAASYRALLVELNSINELAVPSCMRFIQSVRIGVGSDSSSDNDPASRQYFGDLSYEEAVQEIYEEVKWVGCNVDNPPYFVPVRLDYVVPAEMLKSKPIFHPQYRELLAEVAAIRNSIIAFSSLAYPGVVQFSKCCCTYSQALIQESGHNTLWYNIQRFRKICSGDDIRDMSFHAIWKTLVDSLGVFSGVPNTPFLRALSCYTRLFRSHWSNDEIQILLWATAGLEAMLTGERGGATADLKTKIPILFPELTARKGGLSGLIAEMYRNRSNIVHGNFVLPGKFSITRERDSEGTDSECLAVGFLVLLLQKAIGEGVDRFDFKTVRS